MLQYSSDPGLQSTLAAANAQQLCLEAGGIYRLRKDVKGVQCVQGIMAHNLWDKLPPARWLYLN